MATTNKIKQTRHVIQQKDLASNTYVPTGGQTAGRLQKSKQSLFKIVLRLFTTTYGNWGLRCKRTHMKLYMNNSIICVVILL